MRREKVEALAAGVAVVTVFVLVGVVIGLSIAALT